MTTDSLFDSEALLAHPRVHREFPVAFENASARIVSLVPSLSESLFVLGLGDRLVGVTEYCVHPAGAFDGLPKLGGTKDADLEGIVALAPNLVIANQEENTARVVRQLGEAGIDVWVTYPRTVEEGVGLLASMARLGATEAARRDIVDPAIEALASAPGRSRAGAPIPSNRPRVFCPIWRDPWMTIDADTYIHDMIELCGGENVFAAGAGAGAGAGAAAGGEGGASGPSRERAARRYPIVSLEEVVAAAPDVILLPDEPYAFGPADRAELAGLDLPAARTGSIHLVDGTLVSWYGPRITQAIQALAAIIAGN